MDILILLLVMAIFYVGPALWKRYRTGTTMPPVVSEIQSHDTKSASLNFKKVPSSDASVSEVEVTKSLEIIQNVPTIREDPAPWQGKVDQNTFVNGVIFAEIIQAPRSYRPIIKRRK